MKRALLLLSLFLFSCVTARMNSEAEVRAAMSSFMDALNALDAPRISAAFADDATAFFPLAQPQRANGRAEIDAVFRKFIDSTKGSAQNLKLVPQDMKIETGGDLALVTFQIPGQSTARRTFVFRRTNGHWLITHLHASNFRTQ